MKCAEVTKFVYVYLDGEFEPRECAEFEEHVRGCAPCREVVAFEQSFHGLLRSRIERPTAPAHLRERVLAALDREEAENGSIGAWFTRLPLRAKALPALAAAALAVVLLWPRAQPGTAAIGGEPTDIAAAGILTRSSHTALPGAARADDESEIGDLMTQAVAVHEVALPSEVEGDTGQIERFAASHAPFGARPPFVDRPGLHLVGARQTQLSGQPAVLYTYQYKGKRLTVAQFADDETGSRFRRAMFTDRRGPYNIVLLRDRERGVTHSVVGDVDENDLLQLVPASFQR